MPTQRVRGLEVFPWVLLKQYLVLSEQYLLLLKQYLKLLEQYLVLSEQWLKELALLYEGQIITEELIQDQYIILIFLNITKV